MNNTNFSVTLHTLTNGLKVLVSPMPETKKVSTQLWYEAGSKHELPHEKGLAHLLEHMVFKGTARLTEVDINTISHRLSGYSNAFTSYDYTAYTFDFPAHYWETSLDICADTMRNCTLKQDLLGSELKAVLQELNMYKDDYESAILQELMSNIFTGHPYEYPIIGHAHNLADVSREALVKFYTSYYVPNNATLVVVGDVSPSQVIERAQHYFGIYPASSSMRQYHARAPLGDTPKSVTLYRDIQQPIMLLAWRIPGTKEHQDDIFNALCWILFKGKGSRLYQKLVYQEKKATDVDGFLYSFFEHGLICLQIAPVSCGVINDITSIVAGEIDRYRTSCFSQIELARASKQVVVEHVTSFHTIADRACYMGEYFLATGSTEPTVYIPEKIEENVRNMVPILATYVNVANMHSGVVLPLDKQKSNDWHIDSISDTVHEKILEKTVRTAPLESVQYASTLKVDTPPAFSYPAYSKKLLSNGLILIKHDRPYSGTIDLILDFKVDHTYDPIGLDGLCNFTFQTIAQRTKRYNSVDLTQKIEQHGILLTVQPGAIIMKFLPDVLSQALDIVKEIVKNPLFDTQDIELVRARIYTQLLDYWDNPLDFIDQYAREKIYQNHPYNKNSLGSYKGIESITREHIVEFYSHYITPWQTRLVLVGELESYDVEAVVEDILIDWRGKQFEEQRYPFLKELQPETTIYPLTRDQIAFCFAGLSVSCFDPAYDFFVLLERILDVRLFTLREQTGLFYAIEGALLVDADHQPGMINIKTLISPPDQQIAQKLIMQELKETLYSFTQQELDDARNFILYETVNMAESNSLRAHTFLFLDKLNWTSDYFSYRAERISRISLNQAKRLLQNKIKVEQLITLQIGRVD